MTSADALTDPALLLLERLLRLGLLGVRDLARGAHLRILADLTAAVAPANAREEEVSDFETLKPSHGLLFLFYLSRPMLPLLFGLSFAWPV